MALGNGTRIALAALVGVGLFAAIVMAVPPRSVDVPAVADPGAEGAEPSGDGAAAPVEGEGAAKAETPSFDAVRVEADGTGVVAGRAEPGALVEVMDGAEVAASATANADGRFAVLLNLPASARPREITLRAGDAVSAESVIVAPIAGAEILALAETAEAGPLDPEAAGARPQEAVDGSAAASEEDRLAGIEPTAGPSAAEPATEGQGATGEGTTRTGEAPAGPMASQEAEALASDPTSSPAGAEAASGLVADDDPAPAEPARRPTEMEVTAGAGDARDSSEPLEIAETDPDRGSEVAEGSVEEAVGEDQASALEGVEDGISAEIAPDRRAPLPASSFAGPQSGASSDAVAPVEAARSVVLTERGDPPGAGEIETSSPDVATAAAPVAISRGATEAEDAPSDLAEAAAPGAAERSLPAFGDAAAVSVEPEASADFPTDAQSSPAPEGGAAVSSTLDSPVAGASTPAATTDEPQVAAPADGFDGAQATTPSAGEPGSPPVRRIAEADDPADPLPAQVEPTGEPASADDAAPSSRAADGAALPAAQAGSDGLVDAAPAGAAAPPSADVPDPADQAVVQPRSELSPGPSPLMDIEGPGAPAVARLDSSGDAGASRRGDAEAGPFSAAAARPGATEPDPGLPAGSAEAPLAGQDVPSLAVPAMDAPGQGPVLVSDATGVRVLQPALVPGADAEVLATVALDAITYDGAGDVLLSGRGAGGGTVRLYLDNEPVAEAAIGEDGQWATGLGATRPGVYRLRVDQVGDDGEVVSRIETPFQREERGSLAAAMAEAQEAGQTIAVRTVQPGNTLWAIARDRYGEPMMYVRVFAMNRDRIRDPDLIYPGQVFVLPATDGR